MEKILGVTTTLWCVNVVVVVVGDFMGYCGSTVVVASAFFSLFFLRFYYVSVEVVV